MNGGRPLRFLVVALGGWATARVAFLWPQVDSLPSLVRALAPPVAAATLPWMPAARARSRTAPPVAAKRTSPRERPASSSPITPPSSLHFSPSVENSQPVAATTPRQPPPLRPAPLPAPPDRLALSSWLILRDGRAGALATGQLGASQAGARLTYALGHRLALAARVSAPLRGRGAAPRRVRRAPAGGRARR